MKTPGFSMLEIIMVMAVSAIIMTSLFDIYNQTARNMARVERFVFEDTQVLTLKNRLGKDIAGLSAIWFTQAEVEVLLAAQEKKEAPKDFKKRSFYFYSENKNDRFDILTFITTNALQSFGKVIDRFVRVVYKLEDDPVNKGLFRLMRKEISHATEFVDEKALSSEKFYELIGGIKSFETTYYLVDRVELSKQMQAKKLKQDDDVTKDHEQEVKQVIRTVKSWLPSESREKLHNKHVLKHDVVQDDEDKEEDLGGAPVPKFIEIKIVFGQTAQQQEKEYKLGFYVPSTVDNKPQSIFAIRPTNKKQEKSESKSDDTIKSDVDKILTQNKNDGKILGGVTDTNPHSGGVI